MSSAELALGLNRNILTTDRGSSHGLLGTDLVGEGLVRSLLLSWKQGVLSNFKEFESFGEGESCEAELPKLEMKHAQVVEVDLRVQLPALLVHLVMLRCFILLLSVETRGVGALRLPFFRSSVEQSLSTFVHVSTLSQEVRVNVGQQARVLLSSRSVQVDLKFNIILAEGVLALACLVKSVLGSFKVFFEDFEQRSVGV